MHWRETAPLSLVWIVKSVWAWESLILFQTTFSNSKYLSYSLIKINSLDTLADFSITMAQLGQLGYCIFHCIWGRCCSRITSPTPLIWMLIWRFLSDTLMLFTTILWRAHFDSWVSATVDINCSLLCILLTQRNTATLIVHRRGKRGRLGETLWSSERSTSCSGVREASAQLPRLNPLSPLGINSPRGGTKVVHAHKYRSVYLRVGRLLALSGIFSLIKEPAVSSLRQHVE